MAELEKMRFAMEKMEEERAQMVAEVEAQIERALASMAIDLDDTSDYESRDSRPTSPRPRTSGSKAGSRRSSNAQSHALRSFSTESTPAESYENGVGRVDNEVIEEEDEPTSATRKRFSVSQPDQTNDTMGAVDEGISRTTDRIAEKVLQIQERVCILRSNLRYCYPF